MLKNDLIERIKRQIKHAQFLRAENEAKNRSISGGLTPKGEIIKSGLDAKIEALKNELIDIEKLEL